MKEHCTVRYDVSEKFGKTITEVRSKEIIKYDDKGNRIEATLYDADGSIISNTVYKYDNKGNQTEYTNYDYTAKFGTVIKTLAIYSTATFTYYK